MSEHDTQAAFMEYVRWRTTAIPELQWLHAVPNGGARNVVVAVKLKAEGVCRGVWDVFWPCPRAEYHGLYIEFKAGKNKLTPEQKLFGMFVVSQGYIAGVAYSVNEATDILESYIKLGVKSGDAVEMVRIALGGER